MNKYKMMISLLLFVLLVACADSTNTSKQNTTNQETTKTETLSDR